MTARRTPGFAESIALIPFTPNNAQATGLLAPLMRAMGHILYLVGAMADPGYTLNDEEALRELEHAKAHLDSTVATADNAPISSTCKAYVTAFVNAVTAAHAEYAGWTEANRQPNLTNLANRAAAIAAYFDLELAGVIGSDPGISL